MVITIIGMLMALLLPAVNSAREAARRVDCANRERQVAQAAQLYQADLGSFPGYWMATSASNANGVTWPLMLSKYMGRQDIWNTWVNASNGSTTANAQPCSARCTMIRWFAQSNPPLTNQGQWQSYVVNCGLITNNTKPGDGVCFNQLANQTPARRKPRPTPCKSARATRTRYSSRRTRWGSFPIIPTPDGRKRPRERAPCNTPASAG